MDAVEKAYASTMKELERELFRAKVKLVIAIIAVPVKILVWIPLTLYVWRWYF